MKSPRKRVNSITDGTKTLTYNNRGRMKSLNNGTFATNYTYNALGQLIKKSNVNIVQHYYYDEAGHLLGEYFVNGGMIQETVWFGDIPVAILRPKTGGVDIFYVHTDHLNTPRKITRPSDNKLRWRWDPDAFGNGPANENPQALGMFKYNLRLPGQIYFDESGLHYNYFRDYDPATGRYIHSDPIGLRGGINTYAYALNRPVSLIDPLGLCSCSGGSWNVDAGDLNLSLAFGGYVSFGGVSFTCKSNPSTKCQAYVSCVGGGAIIGAGATISLTGSVNGVTDSRNLQGWSGWQSTGSVGPVAGQADGSGGGSMGAGPSAGAGVAAIKCNTFSLNCQCNCESQ